MGQGLLEFHSYWLSLFGSGEVKVEDTRLPLKLAQFPIKCEVNYLVFICFGSFLEESFQYSMRQNSLSQFIPRSHLGP